MSIGCSLRQLGYQVRTRNNVYSPKFQQVLEVDSAYHPAANHANSYWIHRAAHSIPRLMISRASGTSKSVDTWPTEP